MRRLVNLDFNNSGGTRWITLPARLLPPGAGVCRLFRRLFLEQLQVSFSDLSFFGELAPYRRQAVLNRSLGECRRIDWVVYAKRPAAIPTVSPSLTDGWAASAAR